MYWALSRPALWVSTGTLTVLAACGGISSGVGGGVAGTSAASAGAAGVHAAAGSGGAVSAGGEPATAGAADFAGSAGAAQNGGSAGDAGGSGGTAGNGAQDGQSGQAGNPALSGCGIPLPATPPPGKLFMRTVDVKGLDPVYLPGGAYYQASGPYDFSHRPYGVRVPSSYDHDHDQRHHAAELWRQRRALRSLA